MLLGLGETPNPQEYTSETLQPMVAAYASYLTGDLKNALALWQKLGREPEGLSELLMVAECTANEGAPVAEKYIAQLRQSDPLAADACTAKFLFHSGHSEEAIKLVTRLLHDLRTDPWLSSEMTERFLRLAEEIAKGSSDRDALRAIYEGLREPFSARNSDSTRLAVLLHVGMKLDNNGPGEFTLGAIEPVEPHVPWQENFLKLRAACYKAHNDPRLARAERDLVRFEGEQPARIKVSIPAGQPAVSAQAEHP
jgi:hypothetical protein